MQYYQQFIIDALMHCLDAVAMLFLISIGIVVCGLVAEYFSERKNRIQHEETLIALRLQRKFRE